MAEIAASVEVRLWGHRVGAVVELTAGPIVFEYAPEFRRTGLEISPIRLPTSVQGPVRFDELRDKPAFAGLPGVLADSLPDAFGNKVIRAYYAARGQEGMAMSPVQRLLYVGERALGALTYHPAEEIPVRAAELQALDVAALVADARRIVEGKPDVSIPEIYRIGSSAGGMRPKAVVLYNETTGELRSTHAAPRSGDQQCILKFDGVGDGATADRLGRPMPFNRIEAAYARMASDAGIETTDVRILEAGDYAHLIVPRFDRAPDGERKHQHTLGGLLHVDYNDPAASSYEEYLRTILTLGMPYSALEEGYRRAVFNVVAVNQDDHVKNLSLHLDPDGAWWPTPAYDLTFAKGRGWTSQHQMQLNGRTSGIARSDMDVVAEEFGVTRARKIVDRVVEVVAGWPAYAAEAGVDGDTTRRIGRALEDRRQELDGRSS